VVVTDKLTNCNAACAAFLPIPRRRSGNRALGHHNRRENEVGVPLNVAERVPWHAALAELISMPNWKICQRWLRSPHSSAPMTLATRFTRIGIKRKIDFVARWRRRIDTDRLSGNALLLLSWAESLLPQPKGAHADLARSTAPFPSPQMTRALFFVQRIHHASYAERSASRSTCLLRLIM
jgi:hypothetical protein